MLFEVAHIGIGNRFGLQPQKTSQLCNSQNGATSKLTLRVGNSKPPQQRLSRSKRKAARSRQSTPGRFRCGIVSTILWPNECCDSSGNPASISHIISQPNGAADTAELQSTQSSRRVFISGELATTSKGRARLLQASGRQFAARRLRHFELLRH
jgi:hypothetical protein